MGRRRCAGRIRTTSGRPKASVLPEPVGARPATSRPARASGMTADWMGNGSVIASASRRAHRSEGTPSSANRAQPVDMGGHFRLLNSAFGRNNGASARRERSCRRTHPTVRNCRSHGHRSRPPTAAPNGATRTAIPRTPTVEALVSRRRVLRERRPDRRPGRPADRAARRNHVAGWVRCGRRSCTRRSRQAHPIRSCWDG